jgi:hypothetical protein
VSTVDELDAALDLADEQSKADGLPYFVHIYPEETAVNPLAGRVLALGVGRDDFACLKYEGTYAAGDLDGGEPPEWYYGNTPTEYRAGLAVRSP